MNADRAHGTGPPPVDCLKIDRAFTARSRPHPNPKLLDEVEQTLGRAEANLLLRFVGDSLRANMRGYDLIVRYDKNEFLCAMPSITGTVATNRLATVAAVLTAKSKQRAITFGLTEYESPDELQDLLDRADRDLLAARSASGRSDASLR